METLPVPPRYWAAVASREHVQWGIEGGYCQVCHGKAAPLRRMRPGDGIVYYSSKMVFGEEASCQAFTAIGRIVGETTYPFAMSESFVPFRRNVAFVPARDASILPLIDALTFIPDKRRWGYPFRFGVLEIPEADFRRISIAMGVENALFDGLASAVAVEPTAGESGAAQTVLDIFTSA